MLFFIYLSAFAFIFGISNLTYVYIPVLNSSLESEIFPVFPLDSNCIAAYELRDPVLQTGHHSQMPKGSFSAKKLRATKFLQRKKTHTRMIT